MLNTHSYALLVKQISEPLACFPSIKLVHDEEGVAGQHLSKRVNFVTTNTALTLEDGNLIEIEIDHRHSSTKL